MSAFRLAILLSALLLGCAAALCSPAAAAPPDFAELADQLMPSVVNISSSKTAKRRAAPVPQPGQPGGDLFDEFFERFFRGTPEQQPRPQQSLGSGFIISADGFILTNDHVVSGADKVKVHLSDGRNFTAEVKGLDPKLDLALLKIDTGETLPVARLGDSDTLRVGEWVMAIGNPFGLNQTVTVGIVSAKGRVIGAGPYDNFIQTDASINPGNSGGPLFNLQGEVVGINSAIVADGQGIGFATPINAAREVLSQLREEGRVTRGYLGVSIQNIDEELAASFGLDEARGALVADVVEDSPAAKAGIARGDIILAFEDQPIETANDLPRLVAATPVGRKAKLTIWRDGATRAITVAVGRLPEPAEAGVTAAGAGDSANLGLTLADLTPELARAYGFPPDRSGVVVTAVAPDGPAAEASLRPGDLILEINGQAVSAKDALTRRLEEVRKDQVLRLLVQREEGVFYTTVTAR